MASQSIAFSLEHKKNVNYFWHFHLEKRIKGEKKQNKFFALCIRTYSYSWLIFIFFSSLFCAKMSPKNGNNVVNRLKFRYVERECVTMALQSGRTGKKINWKEWNLIVCHGMLIACICITRAGSFRGEYIEWQLPMSQWTATIVHHLWILVSFLVNWKCLICISLSHPLASPVTFTIVKI